MGEKNPSGDDIMRSWPATKGEQSLQGGWGFPSTGPAAATPTPPPSVLENKQNWASDPNYGCVLHTPHTGLFPGFAEAGCLLTAGPSGLEPGRLWGQPPALTG